MTIRRCVVTGLILISFALIWWKQTLSLTVEERALFTKLDAVILHSPPRESDIISAFGASACQACSPKVQRIGALRYTIDIRPEDEGLIFEINRFSGACIRTDRIKNYFQTGNPENGCNDSVCWWTQSQRRWGILGFKLDSPNARCVTSALINSTPEQRPKG